MEIEVEICKYRKRPGEDSVPETLQFTVTGEKYGMEMYVELSAAEARKMARELNGYAAMVEAADVIHRTEKVPSKGFAGSGPDGCPGCGVCAPEWIY